MNPRRAERPEGLLHPVTIYSIVRYGCNNKAGAQHQPRLALSKTRCEVSALTQMDIAVQALRAKAAFGFGMDSAAHMIDLGSCQFTSAFAAKYSIVLLHFTFLPFSRDYPATRNCGLIESNWQLASGI
jgi:hypothetical protein